MEVVLNPLSANRQCHCVEDCLEVVRFYVNCCEYCLPALDSKRITLLFDDHIEERFLVEGEHFRATIAQICGIKEGRDLVQKWYLYTKNRSTALPAIDGIAITLTATDMSSSVKGLVHKHAHDEVRYWISFPRDAVCTPNELTVTSHQGVRNINNAANIDSFRAWLPSYQPNPKHRAEPYYSAKGEFVSPMPLCESEAQKLLLTSLSDQTGTRWAFHKRTAKFYCYRKTHIDREVFHGYLQKEEEVPQELRVALRV